MEIDGIEFLILNRKFISKNVDPCSILDGINFDYKIVNKDTICILFVIKDQYSWMKYLIEYEIKILNISHIHEDVFNMYSKIIYTLFTKEVNNIERNRCVEFSDKVTKNEIYLQIKKNHT